MSELPGGLGRPTCRVLLRPADCRWCFGQPTRPPSRTAGTYPVEPNRRRGYRWFIPSNRRRWVNDFQRREAGGWHKASVSDCLPLAAPIGLSPLLILTL